VKEGNIRDLFNLTGKVAMITGGAGLLGKKHAEVLADFGASCILADIFEEKVKNIAREISGKYHWKIYRHYQT
jgi:NAD(P)-dependent dehydrogenase (short-subunit alcohol dehydrogenase family)